MQYKKQIEDLQMSMRQASESLTLLTKNREKDQFALRHLQNEVSNLSSVVVNLTVQMEALRTWVRMYNFTKYSLLMYRKKRNVLLHFQLWIIERKLNYFTSCCTCLIMLY